MRDSWQTLGMEGKKLLRATGLICAEMFFSGAPYAILYIIFLDIFRATVPVVHICILLVLLLLSLILQAKFAIQGYIEASLFAFNSGGKLRLRLGEHLRRLPLGYFQREQTGSLVETFLFDVSVLETSISHLYTKLVASLVLPCIITIILLGVDWRLALASIITVPLAFLFMSQFRRRIAKISEKHLNARSVFSGSLLEFLHGMKTFKAYNITGNQATRLDKSLHSFCRESIAFENITAPMVFSYSFILDCGLPIMLVAAYCLMNAGTLPTPTVILFIIVSLRFYEPLHNVALYYAMLRQTSGAVKHITTILDYEPMAGDLEPKETANTHVVFDNVSFRYAATPVLENISFTLETGKMLALVGPSGAGKTTIANLLNRFWDVCDGTITLNGQDLKTLSPEYISRQISAVMQEVTLFNDTIYNNIKTGNINSPREKILEAARNAQCEQFIKALPEGYETMIGENGSRLSGGERQRIAIARALLKDAPIVILDEATASLDLDNEYRVQQAIEPLVRSKTLLVIAHRLSTIVKADQILFIENRRIVQRGTFTELIAAPGRFKEFWDCQQQTSRWELGSL